MDSIVAPLLAWYDRCKRDLPWRHDPTPYGVWVSEIMLQQTRVEAVRDYYVRWMRALPTLADLAHADDDMLRKLWEGLGYYTRLRNLKAAAVYVMQHFDGVLPSDPQVLRTLPGVGDYTAGAIASIAFGVPTPAVDGNVLRVLSRFLGDDTDILTPQARSNAVQYLAPIIPADRAGDFTQAMFEWGALVCTPKSPDCASCPVREGCQAYREGRVDALPVRVVKTKRKTVPVVILVCHSPLGVALTPPRDKGLLSGLYGLPYLEGEHSVEDVAATFGLRVIAARPLPKAKHVFTHITWQLSGYSVEVEVMPDCDLTWVRDPAAYALPTAFGAYKAYL